MRPHKFSPPSAPTRHETTTTDMPDEGNDPIRSPAPSPEQRPARGTAHTPGLPGRTMVDPNARVHTRQNPATVIARNERDAKITKIPSSPVDDPTGTGTQPSKPGIVMAGMAGCGENPPDDGSTHIQAATAGPKQRMHDMGRSDPDRLAVFRAINGGTCGSTQTGRCGKRDPDATRSWTRPDRRAKTRISVAFFLIR